MNVVITCDVLAAGECCNSGERLVFGHYGYWEEVGLECCIHGVKLRWDCDYCAAHFEDSAKNI